MDKRYRRLRALIGAAIILPLLATGAAEAQREPIKQPVTWTNPAALAPGGTGITPQVTRLSLGSFEAPAAGVNLADGAPQGAPLAEDSLPRSAKVRTLTIVRASTAQFSAVGVTWREPDRLGSVSVAVRGHVSGGDWGAWQAVGSMATDREPTVGPVAATQRQRGGAELVWLGPSDGIELAVTAINGKTPHDITADLIDPSDAPTDANPVPATTPAKPTRVPMPQVFRRGSWGADERQMNWRPQYASQVKAVVVHHTATSNNYGPADVPKILRSIYQYQTVSRGWGDIGYNVLVDRFGRLWEGRSGGLSRPVVGAQAGGFNTGTAGIAVIGNYSGVGLPPVAIEAAAQYTAWKFSLGPAVDPHAWVALTGGGSTSRYPVGTTIGVPRVFPHRQTNPTECPGNRGIEALGPIRDRAAQILGDLVKPETMRMRLATWRPGDASYRIAGTATPLFAGAAGDVPVAADYDGDGATDVATWTPASGTWKILMSLDGSVQTFQYGVAGDKPVPADYDGDGRADLAVWRPSTAGWYLRGIGEFVFGLAGDKPVPADYNGDGLTDAAVWRPGTGTWYMRGVGEFRLGEAWHIPVPADYNGDGIADPAAWSPATQRFFIRGQSPVPLGARGDVPVPAQYNGDGRADFAVFHAGAYQIRGIGTYEAGAAGDVPVPLR